MFGPSQISSRRLAIALSLAISTWIAGCGADVATSDEPPVFSGPALQSVDSALAGYRVAVRAFPLTPRKGTNAFEFTVTAVDPQSPPAMAMTLLPWMPVHAHGTSVLPIVVATAPDVFVATRVSLYMAGIWELRAGFQDAAGAHVDDATSVFEIP